METIIRVETARGQSWCRAKDSGFTAKATVTRLLSVVAVKLEDLVKERKKQYLYDGNFPLYVLYLCLLY